MSFGPHDYLRHILAEADYLIAQSQPCRLTRRCTWMRGRA